jgi:hypothetical protein
MPYPSRFYEQNELFIACAVSEPMMDSENFEFFWVTSRKVESDRIAPGYKTCRSDFTYPIGREVRMDESFPEASAFKDQILIHYNLLIFNNITPLKSCQVFKSKNCEIKKAPF